MVSGSSLRTEVKLPSNQPYRVVAKLPFRIVGETRITENIIKHKTSVKETILTLVTGGGKNRRELLEVLSRENLSGLGEG